MVNTNLERNTAMYRFERGQSVVLYYKKATRFQVTIPYKLKGLY